MKTSVKRLLIMALSLVLLMTGLNAAYAAEDASYEPVSSNNVGLNNYTVWASTVKSHLVDKGDGTFIRVEAVGDKVVVETYDSSMNCLDGFAIDMELPIFGGFYYGSDRNFLVFGQTNYEESDQVEVVRVVSYTRDWQRIGAASLYGANTYIPFDAGSLRFAEYGGYLYIRTAHEMYMTSDGYHHQANMTLNVRIADMVVTDSVTGISNVALGYVSHSFDQYIGVDGTTLVAADLGDAYPRSVVLMRYTAPAGQDSFMSDGYYYCFVEHLDVLPISGDIGANATGVSIGSFRITDSHYLVAGTTVDQGAGYDAWVQRNIFITATDKNNFTADGTTIRYFTDYAADANVKVNTPYLISLDDGRYFLLWSETVERTETLKYCFVDATGAQVGSTVYSASGMLSGCEPIVFDGKIMWYVTSNSAPLFFTIDLENPEQVTHGHIYEYELVSDPTDFTPGSLSSTCTVCGEAGPDVVMPAILSTDEYVLDETIIAPTCTSNGWGWYYWHDLYEHLHTTHFFTGGIPAYGHQDLDENDYCDRCNGLMEEIKPQVNASFNEDYSKLNLVVSEAYGYREVYIELTNARGTYKLECQPDYVGNWAATANLCEYVAAGQYSFKAYGFRTSGAEELASNTMDVLLAVNHSYSSTTDAYCDICGQRTREITGNRVRSVPMFRMYNPNSGEHFYTGSVEERQILVDAGWKYEGVGFNAPVVGEPVYRLYEAATGEHLYTMDRVEVYTLLASGWSYENVAWNSAKQDEVPQYRLRNPNATVGRYHFTSSQEERDWLISLGWIDEGIGWYSSLK